MWLISMINCPLSVRGHGHHVTSLNFGINVYLLSFSSYSKLIINSCKFFFSPTFIWHCVGCETSAEISPWSYHLWHQNIRIPIGYRSCSVVCVMIMLSSRFELVERYSLHSTTPTSSPTRPTRLHPCEDPREYVAVSISVSWNAALFVQSTARACRTLCHGRKRLIRGITVYVCARELWMECVDEWQRVVLCSSSLTPDWLTSMVCMVCSTDSLRRALKRKSLSTATGRRHQPLASCDAIRWCTEKLSLTLGTDSSAFLLFPVCIHTLLFAVFPLGFRSFQLSYIKYGLPCKQQW